MKIRVVAAVIERDSRFLVCERPPQKRHGGLWEFPGGKVEPGETDFEAVQRELREELGVAVIGTGPVDFSINDLGSNFVIEFLPVEIEGEPICLEHTELAWVAENELLAFPLAPSDRQYVLHRLRAHSTATVEQT
jgi:mutator protein MutT